jgi:hypothetical protein
LNSIIQVMINNLLECLWYQDNDQSFENKVNQIVFGVIFTATLKLHSWYFSIIHDLLATIISTQRCLIAFDNLFGDIEDVWVIIKSLNFNLILEQIRLKLNLTQTFKWFVYRIINSWSKVTFGNI